MSRKLKSLISISCLTLALCFMFTSCVSDPANFAFDYNQLKENVVIIELIYYDNPDVKTVKKSEDILPFDFDKMEILETLELGSFEYFLVQLSEIVFHESDDLTKYSSSAAEISIRIVFKSGDFVIICSSTSKSNFVGGFDTEGKIKEPLARFTGHQYFKDLVNKNFTIKI